MRVPLQSTVPSIRTFDCLHVQVFRTHVRATAGVMKRDYVMMKRDYVMMKRDYAMMKRDYVMMKRDYVMIGTCHV